MIKRLADCKYRKINKTLLDIHEKRFLKIPPLFLVEGGPAATICKRMLAQQPLNRSTDLMAQTACQIFRRPL